MATKLTTYSLPAALKELPKRILIAKWGDNPNVNAPLKMGAKTMTYAATLAKARGHERIALDYQHNTVPGSPAHKESTEPRKVAAYGTLDLVEGDGAYLVIDAYTPSGLENAAEFSDVSPAVERDENGEILFFHSVGLCRNGAVDGLEFQTFEVEFEVKAEEPEAKPAAADMAAQVEALTKALDALTTKLADMQAKLDAMKPAADAVPVETFTAATTQITAIGVRLDAMERKAQIDELKASAAVAGKLWIFSADQEKTLTPDTMRDILARMPKTVSTQRQTKIETFTPAPNADSPARAEKIRARAAELQAKDKSLSHTRAWEQAEREIPVT